MTKLQLLKATESDVELYYDWANDPSVRANSLNSDPIPYENHVNWFTKRIQSENAHLLILVNEFDKIGQIRLEKEDNLWNINYSIAKEYRGKGMGKEIVAFTLDLFPDFHFLARVQNTNIASLKVFEALNFKRVLDEEIVIFEFHPK
jgi:UDP-2,4-diacetamido-2,4,6-trideoxy-beta-L-altropyranose hydrolase